MKLHQSWQSWKQSKNEQETQLDLKTCPNLFKLVVYMHHDENSYCCLYVLQKEKSENK